MKVNLLLNSNDIRSGWVNVDPFATEGDGKVYANFHNLDEVLCDAEATEFQALNIMNYIPIPNVQDTILHWISKIRRGGTLSLGGLDIDLMAKAIVRKDIDLVMTNALLFGSQDNPLSHKKNCLSIGWTVELLQSNGFKILEKRLESFHYFVKAERV
jgi:hypothetical protein